MEPKKVVPPVPEIPSEAVPPRVEAAAGDEPDFPSQAEMAADHEGCCSPATCEG